MVSMVFILHKSMHLPFTRNISITLWCKKSSLFAYIFKHLSASMEMIANEISYFVGTNELPKSVTMCSTALSATHLAVLPSIWTGKVLIWP